MNVENILENEIFKEIKDFPEYYISNFGRVYSCKSKKFLSACDNKFGYLMLHLWKNNKQYMKKIHRLVAEAFIENPNNFKDVNHKDENKMNNHVDNLEWCTREYNINYGTRTQRHVQSVSKPIKMIDRTTKEVISYFTSSYDASRKTGINESNIIKVCHHNRKTAGGFIWEFVEVDKNDLCI